jgi:hypothetical protein
MATAPANAIVKMRSGSYAGAGTINRGGTAGQPITIEALDPANKPVITTNTTLQGPSAAYWRLRNLVVDGVTGQGVKVTYSGTDKDDPAAVAHDIELYGLIFQNCTATGYLQTGVCFNIHRYNCQSIGNGSSELDHGYYLEGGVANLDANCIARDNLGRGWNCFNDGTTTALRDSLIVCCLAYNNGHVVGEEGSGFNAGNRVADPTKANANNKYYNNLSVANGTYGYQWRLPSGSTTDSLPDIPNVLHTCRSFNNPSGVWTESSVGNQVDVTNVTSEDPLFVNAGAADFHLQAGSPVRGIGVAAYTPAFDIEGNLRVVADLGPYRG